MSKRWPFCLLNDEQMSNWLGVKHLPDDHPILTVAYFFSEKDRCRFRWQLSKPGGPAEANAKSSTDAADDVVTQGIPQMISVLTNGGRDVVVFLCFFSTESLSCLAIWRGKRNET